MSVWWKVSHVATWSVFICRSGVVICGANSLRMPAVCLGLTVFSSLPNSRWSKDEDQWLRQGVQDLGPKNWKRISEEYLHNKRTDVQCLHRWQKVRRHFVPGARARMPDITVSRPNRATHAYCLPVYT